MFTKYDKRHRTNLNSRSKRVKNIIDEARSAAVAIAITTGYDGEGEFFFADYPSARKKMDALTRDTFSQLTANIADGNAEGWSLSATKMAALVSWIGGSVKLSKSEKGRWTDPMDEALKEFNARKVKTVSLATGKVREMNLSSRVWNLSGQFKQEIELAVEAAMESGMSAADLSRGVRKYLNEPDRLFRRVRDKSGALRLSKAAEAYHPGTGVYRSSYMNALRMTVTEINTAYRTADYLRWQTMPYVLGIEICITKSRHVSDICDELCGKYPKGFKFTGWHPWCRCYAVPLLPKEGELADFDTDNPEGLITDTPRNFKAWVSENGGRIASSKSLPNFLTNNRDYWEMPKTVTPKTNKSEWRQFIKDLKSEKDSFKKGIKYNKEVFYTHRYTMSKNDRNCMLSHAYTEDEARAIKKLPNLISKLKEPRYLPLDISRPNIGKKITGSALHFVSYEIEIDGKKYILKTKAVRDVHGKYVIEHPYSLKEEKK